MARKSSLAVFFLALCLSRPAVADEPAASSATATPAAVAPAAVASQAVIPPATPEQVHQAVDRAIVYLQTESGAWQSSRKCAACHHVPLALWSLAEAEQQGYAIDKKFLNDTVEASIGSPEKLISAKLFPGPNDPPDTRPLGSGVRAGTAFMAVGARALTSLEEGQKQSLRYIADEIIKKQRDDGSWEFFLSRPPINESQTSDHAWLIMALQGETGADASESQRLALAKAIAWYDAAKLPNDPQDKALKILVAIRVGKAARHVANHDRRIADSATRRWRLGPVGRNAQRRLCHGPGVVRPFAGGLHGRTARAQAGHRLSDRHAKARRQLADGVAIHARRQSRQLEAVDANHLRRRLLGHAWPGPPGAERNVGSRRSLGKGAKTVSRRACTS